MEVDVSGDTDGLKVPENFLEEGAEYKAEVLFILENGNKTITEGFFNTLPWALPLRLCCRGRFRCGLRVLAPNDPHGEPLDILENDID